MNNKTKKYILKRNKLDCEYLTINQLDCFGYIPFVIVGIVDLNEFNKLIKINCENNKISNIINICDNVEYINCKSNLIIKFSYLPDNLKIFLCDYNKIIELNNLPTGLKFLSCDSNELVRLDNLPFGLEYLSCGVNPIENLDYLPYGLTKLYLQGKMDKLKSLGDIPNSIEEIMSGSTLVIGFIKQNFPKDFILANSQLELWKKIKNN